MTQQTVKQRLLSLDFIRAYGIICVMFTHVANPLFKEAAGWYLLFIGSAVLFFMTSGALIFPIKGSNKEFIKHRLLKILPEYIFWSIFYFLLPRYFEMNMGYNMKTHIEWFLFVPTWSTGWFIQALIGLYLFAPIISPWIERASKRAIEYYLAIWMLSGFMLFAQQHFNWQAPYTVFGSFYNCMGYMIAGYYLTRYPISSYPPRKKMAFWAILFVIGVMYGIKAHITGVRYGYEWIFSDDLSINLMAIYLMIFALFSYIKTAPKLLTKLVSFISVNCYEIYLCHIAVMKCLIVPLGFSAWPTIILTIVSSIIAGWLLTKLVNQIRHAFQRPVKG
jgi:surface polysaccharide O-acyltransferase-like enzyme